VYITRALLANFRDKIACVLSMLKTREKIIIARLFLRAVCGCFVKWPPKKQNKKKFFLAPLSSTDYQLDKLN
jgi:hypothetical protein